MATRRVGTREQWLAMMGFYGLLDRAPMGRHEGDPPEMWPRRHDEYRTQA